MAILKYIFILLISSTISINADDYFDMRCTDNTGCLSVEGAICDTTKMTCYCPGYSVISSNMQKCLPVATGSGDTCEENIQCSTIMLNGGACINNKCECDQGLHYYLGRCWTSIGIGGDCAEDAECKTLSLPEATECNNGKCSCSNGFYLREYSDCRPIVTELDQPCALDSDCHIEYSICQDTTNTCRCSFGAINSTTCNATKADIAESYIEANQISLTNKNNLIKKKFKNFVRTLYNKEFASVCTIDSDCSSMVNAMCNPSGYCVCKNGYFPVTNEQNITVCIQELGATCLTNDECAHIENSQCNAGVCSCNMLYSMSASRRQCLLQQRLYNYDCNENSECALFGARGYCKDQGSLVCSCKDGSYYNSASTICWIVKDPGDTCKNELDCASCRSNAIGDCNFDIVTCNLNVTDTCDCTNGYHTSEDGKYCNRDILRLGDRCKDNKDCTTMINNTECYESRCACESGYNEIDGACVLGVGGDCRRNSDCDVTLINTECDLRELKCSCIEDHVPNIENTGCLPIATGFGENCSDATQCYNALGEYADCINEKCDCAQNHHLIENIPSARPTLIPRPTALPTLPPAFPQLPTLRPPSRPYECVPSKGLGDTCVKSTDCNLTEGNEGVVCRNSKCSCDYGYVAGPYGAYCSTGPIVRVSMILGLLCTFVIKLL